ncbi:MAG: S-layer homology domain-containing protein, partial [Armatimonadetes bacterium]|nr:S-layer homology domain-containing protein [Armatimonadota bacterium]
VDSDGDGLPNWRETPPPSPDPALRNLTPEAARQGNCAVDGHYVVWEDDRGAGASATDIYLYDLGSETRLKLTEDEWDQSNPEVAKGVVVWQDDSYGNADVFAWGSPEYYGWIEGSVRDALTMEVLIPAYITCGEVTRETNWGGVPGEFTLPFTPTGPAQTVVVSSPTYHAHEVTVDVVGGDSLWLDVLLVPWGYGLVEGTVREGGTLEPLVDVQVLAGDRMAFTDSDGGYVLCLPGAQSYTITAAKYGYGEGLAEVASLADGERVSLDFVLERLPRGTLAGLVKNARMEAVVAGATVTCGGASTTTGADGRYRLEVVAGSGLTVTATASGYYAGQAKGVVVAADATTMADLVLTPYFSDVAQDFWAFAEIGACVTAGVVAGYEDGTYQPGWPVTRDQMAVDIARALAEGEANVPEFTGTPTFPDVDELFWALDHVEYAVGEGVVGGYDDHLYHPEYQVDRGQMAVFVARAVAGGDGNVPTPSGTPTFPDVDELFWAYRHVEYCVGEGIVRGYDDDCYHPEIVVTRDQMAVYVARAFGL